jgi:hypothetical protein
MTLPIELGGAFLDGLGASRFWTLEVHWTIQEINHYS